MTFAQTEFEVRCEWGEAGVATLAPVSDVVIIVDVMSFSTTVVVATARGARVYPCRSRDAAAADLARSLGAELAGPRGQARYSLSPVSVMAIPPGTRLVLPGPNGAALSLLTGQTPTFAGCLRNCRAAAAMAGRYGRRVAVIPCGERWPGGGLRPAVEDLLGAGAIIRHLPGSRSPEAEVAVQAFDRMRADLAAFLQRCGSGKELTAMGFAGDIAASAELAVDDCVPQLVDGNCYVAATC